MSNIRFEPLSPSKSLQNSLNKIMKKKKKVKGERDRTKLQGREKGICGKWGMLACAYGSLLAIRAKNHYTPLGFFGF